MGMLFIVLKTSILEILDNKREKTGGESRAGILQIIENKIVIMLLTRCLLSRSGG